MRFRRNAGSERFGPTQPGFDRSYPGDSDSNWCRPSSRGCSKSQRLGCRPMKSKPCYGEKLGSQKRDRFSSLPNIDNGNGRH
jgi:hypothetical protein